MKDQRTTIKVSKETKAMFDGLHKELQLKSHDVTLSTMIKVIKYYHERDSIISSSRPVISREDLPGYEE